ncbi:zinc ribbon domain-containing protein [Atopobium fossor]|uniref:zinc ribbon domain-containing protein n=1 Tax=Atopobium fossor TaxID=39487 RepID=UPI0004846E47|nr:zinc ribbon domain-containing protein [Atopobium fossor]
MFCSHCGAQNSDNAKFCTSCGASLDLTKIQSDASTSQPGSAYQGNPVMQNAAPSATQQEKTSANQMFDAAEKSVHQVTENFAKKRYRMFQELKTKKNICVLVGTIACILGCLTPFVSVSAFSLFHNTVLIQSTNGAILVLNAVAALIAYNKRTDQYAAIFSGITAVWGLANIWDINLTINDPKIGMFFSHGIGYYFLVVGVGAFAAATYLLYKDWKKYGNTIPN